MKLTLTIILALIVSAGMAQKKSTSVTMGAAKKPHASPCHLSDVCEKAYYEYSKRPYINQDTLLFLYKNAIEANINCQQHLMDEQQKNLAEQELLINKAIRVLNGNKKQKSLTR